MRGLGMVYLVGAGPGDPGLITVKGLACLRHAEVVLHDRLIHPQLLDEIPLTAERIDVGKEPGRHHRTQAEINALLVVKAREGKIVVRLKGGDPFVFGQGGEECQVLAEAGILFEIVPGVTSAIAVPAYAGIPVTHRKVASTFTVVTGHSWNGGDVDWEALPRGGTLVVLMGLARLREIAAQLAARGWSPETPAAVIHQGTTDAQIVVDGTLANIADRAQDLQPPADIADRAQGIQPPATIVIGQVVRLRQKLDWFDPAFQSNIAESEAERTCDTIPSISTYKDVARWSSAAARLPSAK